ncbi:MAG TPA: MazG family protein [Thermomicrobiales bacterium]|jgi:tetrapyrrole methylase family protein/MazG family protein
MSGSLTIVGLGPGDPNLRTLGAQKALDDAEQIILRTAIHPGLDDLRGDPRTTACDDLYESRSSFEAVYEGIVERVLGAARSRRVAFAVPGHPLYGERTVSLLLARAAGEQIPTSVIAAVSALDAISSALRLDPMSAQAQILDAVSLDTWLRQEPFTGGLLDVAPTRPILVNQVFSREMASSLKLALSRIFPEEHQVVVVTAAGVCGEERIVPCPLHELDHVPVDHLTSVWVPAMAALEAARCAATLHRLAAILRSPEGCPWDREQSHESLRSAAIEEAHEVVDAIEERDPEHLAEELGDLLLQVALHAQIAEEAGAFTIEDVYEHVNRKLVRRHPHVFGDVSARTSEEVILTWQGIKASERRDKGEVQRGQDPLSEMPRSMPVLTRVARLLTARSPASVSSHPDDPGERLFDAVLELVATGLDPERELERVARSRMTATGGPEPSLEEHEPT